MLHAIMSHANKRRGILDMRDKPELKSYSTEHGGEKYEGLWERDTSRKTNSNK